MQRGKDSHSHKEKVREGPPTAQGTLLPSRAMVSEISRMYLTLAADRSLGLRSLLLRESSNILTASAYLWAASKRVKLAPLPYQSQPWGAQVHRTGEQRVAQAPPLQETHRQSQLLGLVPPCPT
jgi:hypothetical protein